MYASSARPLRLCTTLKIQYRAIGRSVQIVRFLELRSAHRNAGLVAATTEVVTVASTRSEFETLISTVVSWTTSITTEVVPYVSTMTVTSTYHDIVQVIEVWQTVVWQTAKQIMFLQEMLTGQELTVTV
ncbi:uncharacterized protein LOC125033013 isoform X2 [Penaeus chinensis]|uniref:uncharacterized protein LOC125033013 isoform X2 n=1 Tax=Penaeus chinensis TaxID=139456 RepID=UPI001FB5B040|nr:uncharacterized protein LOC125033013 isoform X2 [Penaeus chinensis]